jgi:phage tail-like protein
MSALTALRGPAYTKLVHPAPLVDGLPALYHGDDFTNRWLSVFDDVLAPILDAIDSFDAYLDPQLAPADFVDWIASWIGVITHTDAVTHDEHADPAVPSTNQRLRRLVERAVPLFGIRGTARGISEFVEAVFAVRCEIVEGGAVSWSQMPGQPLAGTSTGVFIVRISPPESSVDPQSAPLRLSAVDPDSVQRQVQQLVEQLRPAHLPLVVELTGWPSGSSYRLETTQQPSTQEQS